MTGLFFFLEDNSRKNLPEDNNYKNLYVCCLSSEIGLLCTESFEEDLCGVGAFVLFDDSFSWCLKYSGGAFLFYVAQVY